MKRSVVVLLHVGYWLLYCCLILLICALVKEGAKPQKTSTAWFLFLALLFGFIPALMGFYTFYFLLFRKFLSKKKIVLLILSGLLSTMLIAAITETLMYFTAKTAVWNAGNCIGIGVALSFNIIPNGILALVMRGFINWYSDIKVKEDLSKKHYETELALIKSQLNPHFLFNTINNIDVLILKDPPRASEYLNKLSDIMRFMLYETKAEKVPMAKELDYIEKYIELQKIRTSNPNYVAYSVNAENKDVFIEPMLFIPFIENAFKHAENKNKDMAVAIRFVVKKDKITFECSNRYSETTLAQPDHSGLGNELIHKRLALLYPGRHVLEITNKDQLYHVNLVLTLL